jgi:hypothetical protein
MNEEKITDKIINERKNIRRKIQGINCYKCNRKGHYAKNCPNKVIVVGVEECYKYKDCEDDEQYEKQFQEVEFLGTSLGQNEKGIEEIISVSTHVTL